LTSIVLSQSFSWLVEGQTKVDILVRKNAVGHFLHKFFYSNFYAAYECGCLAKEHSLLGSGENC